MCFAKNIDWYNGKSAPIPSVNKIFNRGLTIEKTNKNGVTTVLENQQLIGHQYGAGGANSGKDKRKYDWAAENLITSIVNISF